MKKTFLCVLLISVNAVFSQSNLKHLLQKYNTESIPYISVNQLLKQQENLILLDAREKKEFEISHLKNAYFVGYTAFNLKEIFKKIPNKKSPNAAPAVVSNWRFWAGDFSLFEYRYIIKKEE